jgi:hypothetical protein
MQGLAYPYGCDLRLQAHGVVGLAGGWRQRGQEGRLCGLQAAEKVFGAEDVDARVAQHRAARLRPRARAQPVGSLAQRVLRRVAGRLACGKRGARKAPVLGYGGARRGAGRDAAARRGGREARRCWGYVRLCASRRGGEQGKARLGLRRHGGGGGRQALCCGLQRGRSRLGGEGAAVWRGRREGKGPRGCGDGGARPSTLLAS